jgi:hypothetical protein
MNAKEIYREFSRNEPSIPIFSRDWWLDTTAGPEAWDVALVQKGSQIVAAMPYVLRRKYGLRVISQPALTPRLGPWFRPVEANTNSGKKLANEKDLMQALIDQLPAFDYFNQCWHYTRTNWLPFSWNGFQQTTLYTYLLPQLGQPDKLWSGLQENVRTHCRTASNRYKLTVRDDLPLDAFIRLNQMTFHRQHMRMPYSETYLRRLDAACAERGCRKFFIAVDPEGRHHAGTYIVWDENSAYGLMNGADPEFRNSHATSLCMWEAIKFAGNVTQQFDFSGSMMERVERFFRGFGTTQVPYFLISKTPSRLVRMQQGLLSVLGEK